MYYTYQDPHDIRRKNDIDNFNPLLEKSFAKELTLVANQKIKKIFKGGKKKK